jgi:hypothetical protein
MKKKTEPLGKWQKGVHCNYIIIKCIGHMKLSGLYKKYIVHRAQGAICPVYEI